MRLHDTEALAERKARLDVRLDPAWQPETERPVLAGTNLRYEVSQRVDAIPCGGIGTMHELVRAIGLPEAIDPTSTCSSGTCPTPSRTTC